MREVALKAGQLEKVNDKRERIVIITQGPDPMIVFRKGEVKEYAVEALAKEVIVDSNGAGDSFVGGFLAGLALGKDFDECIRAGEYCGAHILKTGGVVYKGKPSFEFSS